MAYKKHTVAEEEVKEEAVKEESAAEPEKISLTQEELDALLKKTENMTRQQIAMENAKAEAKKALDEEAKAAREDVYSDMTTRKALEAEQKYKVVVSPSEGEKHGGLGVININGVKFEFKYGEEVVLPESALDILKNSHTFGKPKLVKDADGSHYEPVMVQKRSYNSTPARIDSKLNYK